MVRSVDRASWPGMIRGGLPSDAKERHDARRSAASHPAPTDRSANDPQRRRRDAHARRGDPLLPDRRGRRYAAADADHHQHLRHQPQHPPLEPLRAAHDVWFDQFVAEWGEANGVTTQVDHINTADVPPPSPPRSRRRRARPRRAHRLARPVREERARHDRRRRGAQQPPRRATADGDAQLLQPDHQCLLRSLPRLCARPRQLPPLALGAGRAPGGADDLGRPAGRRRADQASRASRWASGCRTRSTPAWRPRR